MKFSKIISYLLHPILMPIIVLYIGINNVDYLYLIFQNYSNNLYVIILTFTMVLPLISAILFIKSGRVESLEMRKKEERRGPLFVSALIMGIGFFKFYLISKLSFHLSAIYISSIILLYSLSSSLSCICLIAPSSALLLSSSDLAAPSEAIASRE